MLLSPYSAKNSILPVRKLTFQELKFRGCATVLVIIFKPGFQAFFEIVSRSGFVAIDQSNGAGVEIGFAYLISRLLLVAALGSLQEVAFGEITSQEMGDG